MLKQRLIFGAILIGALLTLLYLDHHLSSPGPSSATGTQFLLHLDGLIPCLLLAVLIGFATVELTALFRAANLQPLSSWPAIINVAFVLGVFAAHHFGKSPGVGQELQFLSAIMIVAFIGAGFFVAARQRTEGAISAVGATLLMICYLGLLSAFLLRIRLHAPSRMGTLWLLYFVATVKFCDIGAYFTGRALGRHKLIEWLSPKKTIEGLMGGICLSILFAILLPAAGRAFATGSQWPYALPSPVWGAFFGLTMAIVGQCGDLFESLLKRNAQVKDSSHMIPAFGGLLDVLDSLLPTAPLAYWMLLKSTNA